MATEQYIIVKDGLLTTPGYDYGPNPMTVVRMTSPFVLAKNPGYSAWGGVGQDRVHEPAHFYLYHIERPAMNYSDGRLIAHVDWDGEVGRGKAGLTDALNAARAFLAGERECRHVAAQKRIARDRAAIRKVIADPLAMDHNERDQFVVMLEELETITKGCRASMHEPDEQGMTAKVTGRKLDNAGVAGELMVHLSRNGITKDFDLASLIALARMARIRPALDS